MTPVAKLVDTNVLLYAVDPTARHHVDANRWLDREITSGTTILIPLLVLAGFVRMTTQTATAVNPLSVDESISIAKAWLGEQNVLVPHPDVEHLDRVQTLLSTLATGGNLVNDAHLAALALQYGATVDSFDNDFARFPGVVWQLPGE